MIKTQVVDFMHRDCHTLQEFVARFKEIRRQTRILPLEEARKLMHQFFYVPLANREKVAKIIDEKINGPHGQIPLRLYVPPGTPPFPVILFYHWGGWVFGSIEESDSLSRKLANQTGAVVIAVDYRLAPEYPYPQPLDDCYTAALWAAKHASEFLGDPTRLCVCGESAGGNLAAAVAIKGQQIGALKLALQVLIYPILSAVINEESYRNCADQEFMTLDAVRWFWKQYLPEGMKDKDPCLSPLDLENFEGLPKTVILTAGDDPLRTEGLAYAKLLREHKKSVVTLDYPHVMHGFLDLPIGLPASEKALQDLTRTIKILLSPVHRQHA